MARKKEAAPKLAVKKPEKSAKAAKKYTNKIEREKIDLDLQPENLSAKRLMWLSVILFTAVIILLWSWSIKVRLSNLNFSESPEGRLLQKTQQDWNTVFANQEDKQIQERQKQTAKDNLNKIITTLREATVSNTNTTSGTATSAP